MPRKTVPESRIHPPVEYTEIDPNATNIRNTNVYSEIGQLDVCRLQHADSVDTGYSDACSVQGIVDSFTSDLNSIGYENLQCAENDIRHVNCTGQSNKYVNVSRAPKEDGSTVNANGTDNMIDISCREVNYSKYQQTYNDKTAYASDGRFYVADSVKFITESIESGDTIMADNDILYRSNIKHDEVP